MLNFVVFKKMFAKGCGAVPNIFKNFKKLKDDFYEIEEDLIFMKDARLARIKSCGQVSAEGFWYEQPEDEWVMVLDGEGELEWQDGRKKLLRAGDYLFLPAFEKHRVCYTSQQPPCIWLAIYGKIEEKK